MSLPIKDIVLIEKLRKDEVLLDAKEHRLKSPNGVILMACSDGDQFPDVFMHAVNMLKDDGAKIRPHPFAHHGGGMLIDDACTLNTEELPFDKIFLYGIEIAQKMKDPHTVLLYVHAPCGAARLGNISVVETLLHVVRAKKRIKSLWPGLKVICFFHVDYPPCSKHDHGRKRTYFLSREAFERWYAVHTSALPSSSHEGGQWF